ncbi:MAG TPA: chemotaxis protein CheX [Dissulfurispiraceae bacterium]|nr:chemotaxis protein CheX [Dissulfurispiraceae bacterium]
MSAVCACMPITICDLESNLRRAIADVVTTMLKYEPNIFRADQSTLFPELSGIIGFGGRVSGILAVHATAEHACALASYLLGMSFSEADEIVSDSMGEIANMLAGGLKKYACENEELFKISIPSVIRGADYSTHVPKNSEQLIFEVQTGACSFGVQLAFQR